MVDVEDLVTISEIASRLGVAPNVVSNWRRRYPSTFPTPVVGVSPRGRGGLYVWEDVAKWSKGGPTPIGGRLDIYTVTYLPNKLTLANRLGLI